MIRNLALLALGSGLLACGSSTSGGVGPGAGNASSGNNAGAAAGGTAGGGAAGSSGSAASSGSAGVNGGASGNGGTGGALPSGRSFVDTNARIAILADQLPTMNAAQQTFAVNHYVGTEKQLLSVSQALRAQNPNFLVLHYHLSMWQSAPSTQFIVNGTSWGNDYPTVDMNESWFWHNTSNQRVPSSADAKLLMNIADSGFQQYWASSLAAQVAAGEYDAIFFDSASPALLQGECSGVDPRLAGTAAHDTSFSELGNHTWIEAWQSWMSALNTTLAAQGIPLIPNTSAFVTGWDDTDYSIPAGAFVEGFADRSFAESDWQASTNELLKLAALDKIMILQNYLSSSLTASDKLATRLYYLGNYLLVKGHHAYLDYFESGPLEWYPEWELALGAPTTTASTVADLAHGGVYRRDFANGSVLVNPSSSPVAVALGSSYQRVIVSGDGTVDDTGATSGTLTQQAVTSLMVAATSAEIILK